MTEAVRFTARGERSEARYRLYRLFTYRPSRAATRNTDA
jgi:hypothetical protein